MNLTAKIALSALALALASVHADAASVVVSRPLVTNVTLARPANVDATTAKIRPHLTPWGAKWAHMEALRLESGKISPDAISGDAQSACGAQSACFNIANMPIEDAMLLMMMLISNDAEKDMRDQLAEMQQVQQQKQAQRSANQRIRAEQQSMRQQMQNEQDSKDSLNDMSAEDQLKMQMLETRHQKAVEALSNAMKKYDDTSDSIIKNMK